MSRHVSGFQAWLLQRVSAVYLMLFFSLMLFYLVFFRPENSQELKTFLSQPLITMLFCLGLLSLLYHAWVGLRDIFIDYIHPTGIRLALLSLCALSLLGCGVWGLQLLLMIN